MKKTILSKVQDQGKLKLSSRSKVAYTKHKKVSGGYVITSCNSGRSFIKAGKTKVWLPVNLMK